MLSAATGGESCTGPHWVICINVGAPRYKLSAQKKSDFVQKAGHFHDLAGRGTSGKKARLPRQKRDGWQVCTWVEPWHMLLFPVGDINLKFVREYTKEYDY